MHRAVLSALFFLLAGHAPAAEDPAASYPSGLVRIIIPYVSGGSSDAVARGIAAKLAEKWGKSVIVENKPGANGIIGIEHAAKQAPDGLTLLIAEGATFTVNPALYKNLPYDPLKDFAPIMRVMSYGTLLVVHNSVPAKTVDEFVALAKAKPGILTFGSFGPGSGGHLSMEAFKQRTGTDLTHIPYKGSAPVVTDLIGGRLSAAFISVSSTLPHIQAGTLRALAYANPTRSPFLPDVPLFDEIGFKGFEATTWFCMMAPAGTPRAIVDKINRDTADVLKDPVFAETFFAKRGFEAIADSPESLMAQIRKEMPVWAEVVKKTGLLLD